MSKVLTCTLCDDLFKSPSTFSTCGHTFCHECVIRKLEGKGISTSQCPTCKQPGWKKDLKSNHIFNNAVEHFKALGGVFKSTNNRSAPASRNTASPIQDNSQIANSQEEEMAIEREPLPSTEPVLEEELGFGPAWHAALQDQAPPTTLTQLETLKEEIALLESALQLCQMMPRAGETKRREETENEDLQQNKQHIQQQQRDISSGPRVSFNGKAAAPNRRQARKLSELASQQHNNTSAHGTQEEQIGVIPCTEETTKDGVVTTAARLEGEGARTAPTPAAAATTISDRRPSQEGGADPSLKRPRIEHPSMEAALGIVPDSQPSIEAAAAAAARGNLRDNDDNDGANNGDTVFVGSSAAAFNTQSAAELLNGLAHHGFVAASQLPLDNGNGAAADAEQAAAVKKPQRDEEECIQPFGLAFPASAPRSGSQGVGASAFFSAGPSNNYLHRKDNNKSDHSGGHDTNKTLSIVPSLSGTPRASQIGKSNGNNGPKSDIRALLLSQKAAQEAANAAVPSQIPICLAFAMSNSQLTEKVEAVQRKLPRLTYTHAVSEATTHVIVATDDSLIADKRSRIYLEALARGCWIVSTAWLEACLDTGIRVKENIYEVKGCRVLPSKFYKDDWLVANILGGPERSRVLANQGRKLFASVPKIRVEKFEEKCKNAGRLRDIVLCLLRFAGAKVTESGPCNRESIVITNDKNVAGGFLTGGYRHVVDARWVLDSVSCCKVLPESQYLFEREGE
ncbi:hypothetical protein Ndes2437A_g05513 [Nannochloris sp. 'desiccata']